MMRKVGVAVAAVALVGVAVVYVAMAQGIQFGAGENPLTIERLLAKFDQAQATAPFRYPTACVAGTAEEYTSMALEHGKWDASAGPLQLWTVPEAFAQVAHPEPDRKSGRCDYRVARAGAAGDAHFIAEFFSRKKPRTGEIAFVKVWEQSGQQAVVMGFPNGARGANPRFTFKTVAVGAQH